MGEHLTILRSRIIRIRHHMKLMVLLALCLMVIVISKDVIADPPISGGPSSPAYWWSIGDPISVNSGAYSYDLPLLRMGGPLPLNVALSYRTDNSWFGVGIPWGNNVPYHFRHPFFPEISVEPDGVLMILSGEQRWPDPGRACEPGQSRTGKVRGSANFSKSGQKQF